MAEHLAGLALGDLERVLLKENPLLESGSQRNKDVCFLAIGALRGFPCHLGREGSQGYPEQWRSSWGQQECRGL
jgi:hypothetical protein